MFFIYLYLYNLENKALQASIINFSLKIFGKNSKEVIDNEDSFRKLNMNTSINKSVFRNKENNVKNEEFELEMFNEKNKNLEILNENLMEEFINTLDIDKLRLILKDKCRLLKAEQEKNDQLKIINSLKQKEIQANNQLMRELKKENFILREKANLNKSPEISKIKMNKSSNYFISPEKIKEDFQKNDFENIEILEKQFSGDSDVSYSSKVENNKISKKWFSNEENLTINFDDLEIKFQKLTDFKNLKMEFNQQKEFKFIDVEINNLSDSTLLINNLQLESTESKIFFFTILNN